MKNIMTLMCATAFLVGAVTSVASSAELRVEVEGLKESKGRLYAQLFQGADNYAVGNPYAGTMTEVTGNDLGFSFSGLKPGAYAVRLYLDENGNGKMDNNLFGIPTEKFGFSNKAMANYGPPSFEDMKVTVGPDDILVKTIVILQ
ncbi:DUF2141 domain-containing protein [Emcibacter sp.]|uniref:DUF2141 domain-containing protein n=1 Tax=Emcibacter sp. TaxID=1979954 RepID=UPI003A951F17